MKQLTKKEAEFARLTAVLGNAEEAAYKAGFTVLPGKKAEKLMHKKAVTDEIERVKKKLSEINEAAVGLRRLAFGSVADAIKLAANFGEEANPDSLDLFSVSEIKYQIGKGVEIKFYDRLKALEKLCELENVNMNAGTLSVYEALMRSTGKGEEHEQ